MSYKDGANGVEIVEENNYYPFGLKHKGYNNVVSSNGNSAAQKFGFRGKELNEELGLEWHDFDARNYDVSLGRWMNLDPLAELMRRHSPYNYAFDNPIYFTDPDGMYPMSPAAMKSTATEVYDYSSGNGSGSLKSGGGSDDIVFNSIDKKGNKTELGRIVTDEFDQEINIDQNLIPFDIPENYDPVNVDLNASEIASTALENTGIQAFSLDLSGEAAFKVGVQLEISLIVIVAGKNKGDWGVALQGNGLLGLEGSFTGSASAYWPISNGDLSLYKLRGPEYGVQGSGFGVAGSYFEGFEFTTSYPFANRVYRGASLGGSKGIPELGGSGSAYIGVSEFLYRSKK
ncbi:RHS repeat-associated core domain protein [Psychroflexus torquis ATCC 700755]|uniref:RHS repeat-associated core domain protein n=1 Tax=Psychroflexus torquis (strain ATCC 700755 / CIP 106069 / ACAM 623) TaxID=313595 RepID=K4IIY2_PSYTT|nr:RHS repeat-associated core domain-containing protein [Psychroflexus torquis]AFU69793.1 RHS repeat-associated core domain protein [Psychroflexus torquis ATCC 700755]